MGSKQPYIFMFIPNSSVNNTDLDTVTEVAQLVKLCHTSGDVSAVFTGRRSILVDIRGLGIQLHPNIRPDLCDIRESCEAIKGECVSLNSCTGEDGTVEGLDDLQIVTGEETIPTFT